MFKIKLKINFYSSVYVYVFASHGLFITHDLIINCVAVSTFTTTFAVKSALALNEQKS